MVLLGSAVIFAATLVFKDRWSSTRTTRLVASLSQIGKVSLTPSAQSNGGISPVCGCLLTRVNEWRGITFAGREIHLEREGDAPYTQWLVSGTALRPIELAAAETRTTVDIYTFRASNFEPDWARAGISVLRRHASDVSHARVRAHALKIITRRSLNVDMKGPVPVGVWIPLPGSRIELGSLSTPFPSDTPSLRLVERYPKFIGLQNEAFDAASQQGFPLGDFLGPDIVLWSKDGMPFATDLFTRASERVKRSEAEAMAPLAGSYLKGTTYAAVIRHGGFSTRVAAVPLQERELQALMVNLAQAPSLQQQIDGFHWGGGDRGRFVLTIREPLTRGAYSRMRSAVAARPSRRVRYWRDMTLTADPTNKQPLRTGYLPYVQRSVDFPQSGTGRDGAMFSVELTPPFDESTTFNRGFVTEDDRYPPLPPNAGFNIFGPLRDLTLDDTVGSVSIGGREISWAIPRSLRLEDVSDFQNVGTRQTVVSVPMVTSSSGADLQFSAVGKVTIGGRKYSSASQEAARRGTIAMNVIAVVSGLAGIGAFLVAVFRWTRSRRRSGGAKPAG